MPPNLSHAFSEDETPTKPVLSSSTLAVAAQIERRAEIAIEKLLVAPDDDTLVSACEDLAEIRRLAGQVMR